MISPARPESVSIPKSLARPGPWLGPARPMANTGVEELFESLQLCTGGPRDPPASRHAMEGGGGGWHVLPVPPGCASETDFPVIDTACLCWADGFCCALSENFDFLASDKLNFGGLAFRLTFWSLREHHRE